ncbi:MAG: S8 family serine peptidase [Phycisphaerae bacterium]
MFHQLRSLFAVAAWATLVPVADLEARQPTPADGTVRPATTAPYRSIFDDSGSAGASATASTGKVHRLLARRLAKSDADASLKAWVLFSDKGIDTVGAYRRVLTDIAATYNQRAIERRMKRRSWAGLFDEHDLPVLQDYIAQVQASGASVHVASRWINGVSVQATAAQIRRIAQLPFVKIIQPVKRARRRLPPAGANTQADETSPSTGGDLPAQGGFYGQSLEQLTQINLVAVHSLGFTGSNVVIGILDTGFQRTHEAFNHPTHPVRVLAEWDFVDNDPDTSFQPGDPGGQHAHGTYILGTLGAYNPGTLVGGAYDASFILCKTEDVTAEYSGEEDNYVAGLEFIEAHGGDMATASLSYLTFDDPNDSYTQADLDGLTAITTIGVNVATANGVHCCNAASNRGHDADPSTSSLGAPADAFEVIAVGAVDSIGAIASFSSDGPTADGRVKPEVLARGIDTRTVTAFSDTDYTGVSGTSLSAPLVAGAVACLVDAFPNWTVQKMRQALFDTADYFVANGTFDPDYVLGYGIIDTFAALHADCNDNNIDDLMDITTGASLDCNANGIPDECERDCDTNGVPDDCDLSSGTSSDCDGNGVPDQCDPDCDGDGTPDACETAVLEQDCDFDGLCNGVEIADCPPAMPSCDDCNANGLPDGCDLAAGTSADSDGNGVPDECLPPPLQAAPPHNVPKSRYISIDPTVAAPVPVAIRVELASMKRCSSMPALTCRVDGDCPMGTAPCTEHPHTGHTGWVGVPWDASCMDEDGVPNGAPCTGEFVARVESAPTYRVWTEDPLHIGDCEIVPVATYDVRLTADGLVFSDRLVLGTTRKPGALHFGDVVGAGTGALPPLAGFTPAQGVVNITDVQAVQLTIQGDSTPSAHFTWVDVHGLGLGSAPNSIINVADVQRVLFGFAGTAYAEVPEQLDPGDCP